MPIPTPNTIQLHNVLSSLHTKDSTLLYHKSVSKCKSFISTAEFKVIQCLNLSFPWNAKPNKGLYASNLFRDIIPGNKSRELGKNNRKREKINKRVYFWVGHNCRQLGPNPFRTSQKQTILKHSSELFGQQWKKGALTYLWLPSHISQGFTQAFNSLASHHTQARASSRTLCWNIKEALGWKVKYLWWG